MGTPVQIKKRIPPLQTIIHAVTRACADNFLNIKIDLSLSSAKDDPFLTIWRFETEGQDASVSINFNPDTKQYAVKCSHPKMFNSGSCHFTWKPDDKGEAVLDLDGLLEALPTIAHVIGTQPKILSR